MRRLFAAVLLLLAACARNPITYKREAKLISEKAERAIGAETQKKLLEEYGAFPDPVLSQYVERVGKALAAASDRPKLAYAFTILDADIVNAFAAPGGYIFVTRGLLDQVASESELAAVLGHEIAHVAGWHSVGMIQKQMGLGTLTALGAIGAGITAGPEAMLMVSQTAGLFSGLYLLGYSREHELEADRAGMRYMYSAGYDPRSALSFFEKLGALEKQSGPDRWETYLRSHPPTDQRIALAKEQLGRGLYGRRRTERGQAAYQQMRERLPKLRPEERGTVEGQVFQQDLYGIKLVLPETWSWEAQSGRSLVSFRRSQGEAWGEIRREEVKTSTATAESFAKEFIAKRKWQFAQGRWSLYPAGYGYLTQFYGTGLLGGVYSYRGFFIVRDGAAWGMFCAAVPDRAFEYLVPCEQILRSFELR